MFEKVNPQHPDKVADRIAGALVDVAYAKARDPKIAVEVLIGHGECNIIIETSEDITQQECADIVKRIAGPGVKTFATIVAQDPHLADNQKGGIKVADNGIFRGTPPTREQQLLTALAHTLYAAFPTDGKYILTPESLTVCQSNADIRNIEKVLADFAAATNKNGYSREMLVSFDTGFRVKRIMIEDKDLDLNVNPLGPWTGGTGVDCGATNRKLGSDMGDSVTGGGLHGKDLSKADVSVNIVCYLLAVEHQQTVTACCSIGDEQVTFHIGDGHRLAMGFSDIVERARLYIHTLGGFERFAEWGLIRHRDA